MNKPSAITDKQYLEISDKYYSLKNAMKGKTLIGTCGECQHWTRNENIGTAWGICECVDNVTQIDKCVSVPTRLKRDYKAVMETRDSFGCNQWKAKEKPCSSE